MVCQYHNKTAWKSCGEEPCEEMMPCARILKINEECRYAGCSPILDVNAYNKIHYQNKSK